MDGAFGSGPVSGRASALANLDATFADWGAGQQPATVYPAQQESGGELPPFWELYSGSDLAGGWLAEEALLADGAGESE